MSSAAHDYMNDCDGSDGITGSFVEFLGFGCAYIYEAPNSNYNLRGAFMLPSTMCPVSKLFEVNN